MGVLKQGILGGFSGKVGTVVGGFWKGIPYIRGLAPNITDARSPAQLAQRAKMALVVKFLRPSLAFLKTGFKAFANGQTAFNAATAYVVQNAVTGSGENYSIDYPNVLVSRGNLPGVVEGQASVAAGVLTIDWADNTGIGFALEDDKALVLLYNPENADSKVLLETGAVRSDTTVNINISYDLGNTVHVYLAFQRADKSMISDSKHVASLLIA